MDDRLIEQGRAAVASPHWRLLPGMLATKGGRSIRIAMPVPDDVRPQRAMGKPFWTGIEDGYRHVPSVDLTDWRPDFSDPLTALGLLVLVREAWADAGLYGVPMVTRRWEARRPIEWRVVDDGGLRVLGAGATEVDALLAALLAASTPRDS